MKIKKVNSRLIKLIRHAYEARDVHAMLDDMGIDRVGTQAVTKKKVVKDLNWRVLDFANSFSLEGDTAHTLLDACGTPKIDEDGNKMPLEDRIKIYAQHRADRPISGLTEDTICIPVSDYDQLCQAAEKYHATQRR